MQLAIDGHVADVLTIVAAGVHIGISLGDHDQLGIDVIQIVVVAVNGLDHDDQTVFGNQIHLVLQVLSNQDFVVGSLPAVLGDLVLNAAQGVDTLGGALLISNIGLDSQDSNVVLTVVGVVDDLNDIALLDGSIGVDNIVQIPLSGIIVRIDGLEAVNLEGLAAHIVGGEVIAVGLVLGNLGNLSVIVILVDDVIDGAVAVLIDHTDVIGQLLTGQANHVGDRHGRQLGVGLLADIQLVDGLVIELGGEFAGSELIAVLSLIAAGAADDVTSQIVDSGVADRRLAGSLSRVDSVGLLVVDDAILLAQIHVAQAGVVDLDEVGSLLSEDGHILIGQIDGFILVVLLVGGINVSIFSGIQVASIGGQVVILLAQGDDLVTLDGGALVQQTVAGDGDHGLVGVGVGQRVSEHDRDPLTGSIADGGVVVVVQQANDGSVRQDVLVPVGAGVAASLGIVADSGQQHLGSGSGGHGIVGTKGAVTAALDQLGHTAVVDVTGIPGGSGNVGEDLRVLIGDSLIILAVVLDDIDHLSDFGTGDGVIGTEVALSVALHDVQSVQQLNGVLAILVDAGGILVGISLVGASKGRDGEDHRQSQGQRENFFQSAHGLDSSSMFFRMFRPFFPRIERQSSPKCKKRPGGLAMQGFPGTFSC